MEVKEIKNVSLDIKPQWRGYIKLDSAEERVNELKLRSKEITQNVVQS